MKLEEFERKLGSVLDDKLLKMLDTARRDGPDVAARLLEQEAKRRGLILSGNFPSSSDADARVRSAFAGLDRSEGPTPEPEPPPAEPGAAEAQGAQTPPGEPSPGAWLTEELSRSRFPAAVKVVLYLAALGALVGLLFKFLQK